MPSRAPRDPRRDDVDLVPLYEEAVRAVVAGGYAAGTSIGGGMPRNRGIAHCGYARDRGVIDAAFADHAVSAIPQVDRFVASLFAQVASRQLGVHRSTPGYGRMPMSGPTSGESARSVVDPVLAQIAWLPVP